ncbi:hypothetical protein PF010_g2984 [Phytophthora fragariae]|uniref:Uncharacterized protein n=1 Tax=Phytophthora fragariae TaxID=53985 RepID=A0A6A3THJ5_9STRA|nr:hypothetical protein PF011_g1891 [Phytophthora fragariae]KAE9132945.1 hypothetical protein PF010_g2984 [Phytophthora fragariae]KAE9136834.1 hypothetical protein PF007_g2046 [Phytophthora fragariae]KAE9253304.1 hypothetical protein PF004_g1551 [Phytophthora fragariae]KAE9255806.1 hypothetical protein PF002_g2134 [Phytophthora fragariae]
MFASGLVALAVAFALALLLLADATPRVGAAAMVTAAFGACVPCVAAAVATALGGFTCALPPTWRGQGGDGGWIGGTDANERALQRTSLRSPCCLQGSQVRF